MLRAAIYARYSSERQKATSIEDQLALWRGAASRFDCVVLHDQIYTDQEISGAIEQRPAYTRLLAAAKAKQFDAIIVESQDRLWRDQGEMHHALKRLRFWEVRVLSVATGTDLTDKSGKLMASVLGWKDEVFIEDLKDKTWRGMSGQIKRGLSAGGRSYGYRSMPVYANGQITGYHRVIDPKEAKVVQRIFQMYSQGTSPKTIARTLNAGHVPPPRRSHLGWTWTSISGSSKRALGILHNPIYVGRITWNRTQKVRNPDTGKRVVRIRPMDDWVTTDAPDLRIITDELWEAVQSRSAERRIR